MCLRKVSKCTYIKKLVILDHIFLPNFMNVFFSESRHISETKIVSLFDKYKDSTEDSILAEGIITQSIFFGWVGSKWRAKNLICNFFLVEGEGCVKTHIFTINTFPISVGYYLSLIFKILEFSNGFLFC